MQMCVRSYGSEGVCVCVMRGVCADVCEILWISEGVCMCVCVCEMGGCVQMCVRSYGSLRECVCACVCVLGWENV